MAATSGRLWALAALYFTIVVAFYGVSFWLPQIIKGFGASILAAGFLTAIPYFVGATAMVLAEQRMIPRVFAAVVRAVTAVR